jgi:plastocyanin
MTRRTRMGLLGAAVSIALVGAAAAEARTYHGYVGPGATITLQNASGARVSRIPTGRHSFVIHDRSSAHNFVLYRGTTRLRGTTVRGTGVVTWALRITRGNYRYLCAPHASSMRGSFRAG